MLCEPGWRGSAFWRGSTIITTHAITWIILWPAFIAGLIAAIAGALLLTWTEKQFADVQEAIIGGSFLLAATAALMLLASNPLGAEHMKDILVDQILWVNPISLQLQALLNAVILAIWIFFGSKMDRVGFLSFVRLRRYAIGASRQAVFGIRDADRPGARDAGL